MHSLQMLGPFELCESQTLTPYYEKQSSSVDMQILQMNITSN